MTIAVPTSGGWTFAAQVEEDEFGMLSLNSPNRVTGKRQGHCLLLAVLKVGWRIVESTPEERPERERAAVHNRAKGHHDQRRIAGRASSRRAQSTTA
jgi:hypothetical protein